MAKLYVNTSSGYIIRMAKRFKRIYLEITNLCNLSCSFCPIDQRQAKSMEISEFKKTLDQVAPLTDQVCLHLMGEPLAHPHISEILSYCSKLKTKIQLTTNGLLLGKSKELIANEDCVFQVNISLQSYMDNFPRGNFNAYLAKVFEFIDFIHAARPEIYINLRLWNLTESKTDSNGPIFDFIEKRLNVSINRKVDVGAIKSKKVKERLYLHFDSRFEWPRMELPLQGEHGRCNALKDHVAIHADGTVVPCCLDDQKIIKLGNCFESGLESILDSSRAITMQEGFARGVLTEELCKRCSFINRFKK